MKYHTDEPMFLDGATISQKTAEFWMDIAKVVKLIILGMFGIVFFILFSFTVRSAISHILLLIFTGSYVYLIGKDIIYAHYWYKNRVYTRHSSFWRGQIRTFNIIKKN